jgi:hypothetical protein
VAVEEAIVPKLDLKRAMRRLYYPPVGQPVLVDVPEMAYLMVDGRGAPGNEAFQQAIEALFSVAFTAKFAVKRIDPQEDFTVMPLEAVLWTPDGVGARPVTPEGWSWTLMIVQPPAVTEELARRSIADATERGLSAASQMRLERFREGLAAQVMHVGSYADEEPTIEKLHAFIAEHDYPLRGRHHEIYLSDPRRSAPERLKTVLRQPVGL